MDQKWLQEIRERHEAVRRDGWPVPNGGLEAHADRGWLLDAIAEAQAAEKAAHPLRIVSTQIADTPGGVRTVIEASTVLRDATAEEQRVIERIPEVHTMIDAGKLDEADALLDEIERVMGRGFVETAGMRATVHFERPAPAEWPTVNPQVAALPDGTMAVLPAGTVMREASAEDIAAAHEQRREAVRVEQSVSLQPQRPRVGPWVESGITMRARFDAGGIAAADIWEAGEGTWRGTVRRPFSDPLKVGWESALSLEAAQTACDAVLATWADFDGVPQETLPDALTQARTLLRRVRLRLGGHPKDGNAASVAHDVQMVDEIDAFLAGLPVTPAPRTWTEEQIREALERASDRRDIDADEPLTLSSRGMWKALREVGS